jgi:hypothetical protein
MRRMVRAAKALVLPVWTPMSSYCPACVDNPNHPPPCFRMT